MGVVKGVRMQVYLHTPVPIFRARRARVLHGESGGGEGGERCALNAKEGVCAPQAPVQLTTVIILLFTVRHGMREVKLYCTAA